MYDPSMAGQTLCASVFVNLGTWHIYKHCSLLVWRKFADVFLAGLFHCLFPGSCFFTKPRLPTVTHVFVLLRMAYPSFRDELSQALYDIDPGKEKRCLLNLQGLCQYFIPVVRIFFATFR